MSINIKNIKNPFFVGVAGAGMSAIAQYLQGIGMRVSGSDRFFNENKALDIKEKLETLGIQCFKQGDNAVNATTDLIVVSTAIEDTVPEVRQAKEMGIPIIKRSELLALIAATKKTIAIGGTSGKSTTAGMLYHILEENQLAPSVITGAGLINLIQKGKIGNATVGKGEWLVIEADESDGSIVQYQPEIGVLLNIEKDHKELNELKEIFKTFQQNSSRFIVNVSNTEAASLSVNNETDFGVNCQNLAVGFNAENFIQDGFYITFTVDEVPFKLNIIGEHNMENAVAATAAAFQCGVSIQQSAKALATYKGIYRRSQILGEKNGVWVIDDFAHNPAKCAAAIRSCQPMGKRVVAWFQPHGYTPTKFLRNEFVQEISEALRPDDEIWMSEIFYAGGTATKDISANDLIEDIAATGKKAFFVTDRNSLLPSVKNKLQTGDVLLLMGARDPSLEQFAKNLFKEM